MMGTIVSVATVEGVFGACPIIYPPTDAGRRNLRVDLDTPAAAAAADSSSPEDVRR
jgi:hypothetical protein